jgi:predicted RNA-binding Zn ribbon-like protein
VNTGQWFLSADGSRWWFDSGSLSLDFAYTGSMGADPEWEKFRAPADLGDWIAGRFDRATTGATEGDLVDALALRSAIASLAHALSDGQPPSSDDIDTVNLYAATPNIPPALVGGNRQAGRSSVRVGQALASIARDSVELFGEASHERIRRCAADDCGLIFFDESRSNNRRWCSMQRCGNRSKVRAHRARTAAGDYS